LKKHHMRQGLTTMMSTAALLAGGAIVMQHSTQEVHAATNNWVEVQYTSCLRQGPGTQYGVSRYLQPGETYKYFETRQAGGYTWYRVSTTDWVASAGVVDRTGTSSASTDNNGSQSSSTSSQGVVQINYASNLRLGAGLNYGVSRGLAAGDTYKYYETRQADGYTWYRVSPSEWVASAGASVYTGGATNNNSNNSNNNSVPDNSLNTSQGVVTISSTGNLRQGAGTSYGISRTLNAGETYQYYETCQAEGYTWYRVSPSEWVASAIASVGTSGGSSTGGNSGSGSASLPNSAKVSAVINLAQQQLGKPYVWGGKGPDVFDCSGLMYYVYLNATGINIGGWTVPQESSGTQVSLNALQPGDILFWGPQGATYHDALYIGNNQYIAAPEPGDVVKIQTMSQGFMPSFAVRVL
jgi:cell wall-associated NlpC family hydrolase